MTYFKKDDRQKLTIFRSFLNRRIVSSSSASA